MCQCGNPFCDLPKADSSWANQQLDQFMANEEMVQKFPDAIARQYHGELKVREDLLHRDDTESLSPRSHERAR